MFDISNAVTAFQWGRPYELLRRRLPLDLLLELDGRATDGVDWQYFFVEFWRIANNSVELTNRIRIYNIIRSVRAESRKLLREGNAECKAGEIRKQDS
jgi:hypothetical protein